MARIAPLGKNKIAYNFARSLLGNYLSIKEKTSKLVKYSKEGKARGAAGYIA